MLQSKGKQTYIILFCYKKFNLTIISLLRVDPEKPPVNLNEDEMLKAMYSFMCNYIQQKEKIDKQLEPAGTSSDSSSPEHNGSGSISSIVSSPTSLLSPGKWQSDLF